MTLGFVLSKMRQILLRLWAVDRQAQPRPDIGDARFARAAIRPIYSRNGIRVSVAPKEIRDRE